MRRILRGTRTGAGQGTPPDLLPGLVDLGVVVGAGARANAKVGLGFEEAPHALLGGLLVVGKPLVEDFIDEEELAAAGTPMVDGCSISGKQFSAGAQPEVVALAGKQLEDGVRYVVKEGFLPNPALSSTALRSFMARRVPMSTIATTGSLQRRSYSARRPARALPGGQGPR